MNESQEKQDRKKRMMELAGIREPKYGFFYYFDMMCNQVRILGAYAGFFFALWVAWNAGAIWVGLLLGILAINIMTLDWTRRMSFKMKIKAFEKQHESIVNMVDDMFSHIEKKQEEQEGNRGNSDNGVDEEPK